MIFDSHSYDKLINYVEVLWIGGDLRLWLDGFIDLKGVGYLAKFEEDWVGIH